MAEGGGDEDDRDTVAEDLGLERLALPRTGSNRFGADEVLSAMRELRAAMIRLEKNSRKRDGDVEEIKRLLNGQALAAVGATRDFEDLKKRVEDLQKESKETGDTVKRWKDAARNLVLLAMGLGWLASQFDRVFAWLRGG